jgi:outer membrane protein assembly factor BamB
MPDRHRRAAAPLSTNGRLFVLGEGTANRIGIGENTVRAYDAYNGLKLWERRIRGALRVSVTHDSGNSAVNDDSMFVTVGDGCVQLDAATGETVRTHQVPPASDGKPRKWGYIAVDGDILYGSRTERGRTADCVFAIDLDSGRQLWKHDAAGISQGSIAISRSRFHFAASGVTEEQRKEAIEEQTREVHRLSNEERAALLKKLEKAAVYNVVALDAESGEKLWEKPVEITGAVGGAYWCSLGAICSNDTLVLFGVFLDGHYWTQFFSGQFESREVVALSAQDGYTRWRKRIGYRVRPVVVGETLHAEPWAYDLVSGQQRKRIHPVTGREEPWQFARPGHHCGAPAASPHMLLFRSLNLGWYDLDNDFGTQHFGGQRTGCWINFIPANGLLMMPEASSGCMCAFPNICTVVFKQRDQNRQWAYFSQPGSMTPVKRLALNLAAPGDRKAPDGSLWLGYPRPGGSLVLQYQMSASFFPKWSYFKHDPARLQIDGTDTPWVFRSGVNGMRQCKIPVADSGDGKARYTVRLAFAELVHDAAGKRVFDIKVQNKVVAENFDIFQQLGGKNRALIKEFTGFDADTELTVEFVSKIANPAPTQLPVLQGIEIERERTLTLGVSVPSFLLNDGEPQQAGDVVVVNNKDNDFAGTLRFNAPKGVTVTPAETRLNIAAGERATIAVTAVVAKETQAGKYTLPIELLRSDGTIDSQHETVVEHLGDLRRVILSVAEDAHVGQSAPTTNYGTNKGLNVDGGDRKMGDHHHGITYLKFRLQLDGKPVSAKLRLHNGSNPSGNSGQICLVSEPWMEKGVTYNTRPKLGATVAKVGPVSEHQVIEIPLDVSLEGLRELNLAIDPTGCDGINYISREGGKPAELVVEYISR